MHFGAKSLPAKKNVKMVAAANRQSEADLSVRRERRSEHLANVKVARHHHRGTGRRDVPQLHRLVRRPGSHKARNDGVDIERRDRLIVCLECPHRLGL